MEPNDLAIDRGKGAASISSCPTGKPPSHGPVGSHPSPGDANIKK